MLTTCPDSLLREGKHHSPRILRLSTRNAGSVRGRERRAARVLPFGTNTYRSTKCISSVLRLRTSAGLIRWQGSGPRHPVTSAKQQPDTFSPRDARARAFDLEARLTSSHRSPDCL